MPGANKKMIKQRRHPLGVARTKDSPRPLQAHIGRHVRALFDEVAREPIPEHLLRLLKDLERTGDK